MSRVKIAIVIEAIPPHCGGAEQVAWVQAMEMARNHDVAVVTYGPRAAHTRRDGVEIFSLPKGRRNLIAYSTLYRGLLDECLESIEPTVIHCHMPYELGACIRKRSRAFVSTIHDGVPENELIQLTGMSRRKWLRFKLIRRINLAKSDAITCVSRHNLEVMRTIYPKYADKFSFIPNPIHERFFTPATEQNKGYVLNFGRQIPLKMGVLLDVARRMPQIRFVFVGTGEMVRDHGLSNVEFVGFSASVVDYIDDAALCVFPSLSENFPLVGLEAMARGRPVIATQRGFSEYIEHMNNGYLLPSPDPTSIEDAISLFMKDTQLSAAVGQKARATAEQYRPVNIARQYDHLYRDTLAMLS